MLQSEELGGFLIQREIESRKYSKYSKNYGGVSFSFKKNYQ